MTAVILNNARLKEGKTKLDLCIALRNQFRMPVTKAMKMADDILSGTLTEIEDVYARLVVDNFVDYENVTKDIEEQRRAEAVKLDKDRVQARLWYSQLTEREKYFITLITPGPAQG